MMKNMIKDLDTNILDEDIEIIVNIMIKFNNLTTIIEKDSKSSIKAFFRNPSKFKNIREIKLKKNLDFVFPAPQSGTSRFLKDYLQIEWQENELYDFAIKYQHIFRKLLLS